MRFFTKENRKPSKSGCWDILDVDIWMEDDSGKEIKIGHYSRNYPTLYNTFYSFKKNDQWYALYSPDYTCTRIMTLPDCKDIGGESPDEFGFCPTGYFVPRYQKDGNEKEYNEKYFSSNNDIFYADFGFICGCVWGDDSSWKIQYLDLSECEKGIIKRDDRFGYIELAGDYDSLKNCIDIIGKFVKITSSSYYELAG